MSGKNRLKEMGNFNPEKWDLTTGIYINDPLRTVMGVENVNRNGNMADSELLLCS